MTKGASTTSSGEFKYFRRLPRVPVAVDCAGATARCLACVRVSVHLEGQRLSVGSRSSGQRYDLLPGAAVSGPKGAGARGADARRASGDQ